MPLPYVKPGVTVQEEITPGVQPVLLDPSVLCIVGPARGYQEFVEQIVLDDHAYVELRATNVDPATISVRDAANITLTPFVKSVNPSEDDYDVDISTLATDGKVRVRRSMQTLIDDGEQVTVYYENAASPAQADAHTSLLDLNKLVSVGLPSANASTQAASVSVQSAGTAPAADYTLANVGSAGTSIVWVNSATVLKKFQTVYVDYAVGVDQFTDVELQLNNLSTVAIDDDADNIVVKTAPGTQTVEAVEYTAGTTTDLDYILSGAGATTRVARSQGSTTIGGAADKLRVRVNYRATPPDHWSATRCYSQSDVETKFGPAFDSAGQVATPVSAASLFAFQAGTSSVVIQALYAFDTETEVRSEPTGSLENWEDTLIGLRAVNDITLICPLVSTGADLTIPFSDGLTLGVLLSVQNHINFMQVQQAKFIMMIAGEDGTDGILAQRTTLQDHADSLGSGTPSEETVLFNESVFSYSNPVTGQNTNIGGQYFAAAVAGTLCRYPVQIPLTRKRINGFQSIVNKPKTEAQKDEDAQTGLAVVEMKRGRLQCRHGITTSQDTRAHQEISVIRGRNWMLMNLVDAFDQQAIGRLVIDDNAAFLVQLLTAGELELLIQQGAIRRYGNIQVSGDPFDPTAMKVRFDYTPIFPLNHIHIVFSINSSQGVVFDQSTATQGF